MKIIIPAGVAEALNAELAAKGALRQMQCREAVYGTYLKAVKRMRDALGGRGGNVVV